MIFGLETQALNMWEDYDTAVITALDVPTLPPRPALCQLLKSTVQCCEADGTTLALSFLFLKKRHLFHEWQNSTFIISLFTSWFWRQGFIISQTGLNWLCSRG